MTLWLFHAFDDLRKTLLACWQKEGYRVGLGSDFKQRWEVSEIAKNPLYGSLSLNHQKRGRPLCHESVSSRIVIEQTKRDTVDSLLLAPTILAVPSRIAALRELIVHWE